jgi:hypothetical protein
MGIMLDISGKLRLIWIRLLRTLKAEGLVVSETVDSVFLEMVRALLFLN